MQKNDCFDDLKKQKSIDSMPFKIVKGKVSDSDSQQQDFSQDIKDDYIDRLLGSQHQYNSAGSPLSEDDISDNSKITDNRLNKEFNSKKPTATFGTLPDDSNDQQ